MIRAAVIGLGRWGRRAWRWGHTSKTTGARPQGQVSMEGGGRGGGTKLHTTTKYPKLYLCTQACQA